MHNRVLDAVLKARKWLFGTWCLQAVNLVRSHLKSISHGKNALGIDIDSSAHLIIFDKLYSAVGTVNCFLILRLSRVPG